MDEKKFLFVTCVNDERQYLKCKEYIRELSIPTGYKVELFSVRNAESMTKGYNLALSNNARYKIYLHQDTFVTKRDILQEILNVFKVDPRLGLIGTIGCKKLPSNGIWWGGDLIVGKAHLVYLGEDMEAKGIEVQSLFEVVEAVDGYFMATRFDIPWREEISGFHHYDTSQCIEFNKNDYIVGVPRQLEYWCLHNVEHQIDLSGHSQLLENFQLHYRDTLNR